MNKLLKNMPSWATCVRFVQRACVLMPSSLTLRKHPQSPHPRQGPVPDVKHVPPLMSYNISHTVENECERIRLFVFSRWASRVRASHRFGGVRVAQPNARRLLRLFDRLHHRLELLYYGVEGWPVGWVLQPRAHHEVLPERAWGGHWRLPALAPPPPSAVPIPQVSSHRSHACSSHTPRLEHPIRLSILRLASRGGCGHRAG
mmetsp:Transcript_35582/g.87528  ORF Transcript_35582/g.87528 Transcript_35582/m.87528 type:complete len:202 (-) Transcript_35582:619-1224(-)